MNHYVSLSLTNRKSSVHLHALYSLRTAIRTFTARRDQLVICGQYVPSCGCELVLLFTIEIKIMLLLVLGSISSSDMIVDFVRQ
jgi:hypothetical protein